MTRRIDLRHTTSNTFAAHMRAQLKETCMRPSDVGSDETGPANDFQALWRRLKVHPLAHLGPGLITGVVGVEG